jgi:RNA polymerase sigma-70 factor (ECF subfamily)
MVSESAVRPASPRVPHVDHEPELIQKSRAGSAEAYCELVRLHQARVRAYIARYVRDKDAVDDIAQEVFLGGHRTLDSFRAEAPFRLWLLGIARRRIVDHLRRESQRRSREAYDPWARLMEWNVARAEADEARLEVRDAEVAALEQCLQALTGDSAEMVRGYYFRALTTGEIARRLGKKDSAVRMALVRVRQALRACVEKRLAAQEAG